jgi:hypothetical protein
VVHRFGKYPLTNYLRVHANIIQTHYLSYVKSVAIDNATNTTTTAPLLFLLSIHILASNYLWGGCAPLNFVLPFTFSLK